MVLSLREDRAEPAAHPVGRARGPVPRSRSSIATSPMRISHAIRASLLGRAPPEARDHRDGDDQQHRQPHGADVRASRTQRDTGADAAAGGAGLYDRARDLDAARPSWQRDRGSSTTDVAVAVRSTHALQDTIALIAPGDLLAAAASSDAISAIETTGQAPAARHRARWRARHTSWLHGAWSARHSRRARTDLPQRRAARPARQVAHLPRHCNARRTSSSSRRPRTLSASRPPRARTSRSAAVSGFDWLRGRIEALDVSGSLARRRTQQPARGVCTESHREPHAARARETRERDSGAPRSRNGSSAHARNSSHTCRRHRRPALRSRRRSTSPRCRWRCRRCPRRRRPQGIKVHERHPSDDSCCCGTDRASGISRTCSPDGSTSTCRHAGPSRGARSGSPAPGRGYRVRRGVHVGAQARDPHALDRARRAWT